MTEERTLLKPVIVHEHVNLPRSIEEPLAEHIVDEDILGRIEYQLKKEGFEITDLMAMLAAAAKEIRQLRGLPDNPELLEGWE